MAPELRGADGGASSSAPARRLWRRYLRARGARIGLAMICVFAAAAFLAPCVAHRLPYYWRDGLTGEASFPLIGEFFSPSDTTEPLLEKGLNFLFLFLPAAAAVWALLNRFLPALAAMESRATSFAFGALLSLALWAALGGMILEGGGRDWLYRETRPLPETDDVADPGVLDADAAAMPPARRTARRVVLAALADASLPDGATPEQIAGALRQAITGAPLAEIGDLAASGGPDARGITDRSLGSNRERWNRIVVEFAFPGLLKPFVEFRAAFLVLSAAVAAALAGMTFVIMTAAGQFALSPRWLVLLALGAALALPFGGGARNDHTPYRQLAAEGRGYGIFPPIPYGPNEQGFGPRLPPDWAAPAANLVMADVIDTKRLVDLVERPDPADAAAVRVSRLIRKQAGAADPARAYLDAANRVIDGDCIYAQSPADFAGVERDLHLLPYVQAADSASALSRTDARRFNRLLLERSLSGSLRPVPASRWKKPRHLPGSHFFGTDESGRDVLTRLLHGARISLSVGFVSVALATAIGLVLGSLAAYYAGWVDIVLSRLMELMMCFPSFFLILAVIAVLDRRSILNIMLIIGLTSWTGVARLIRGEMLKHKKMDYVQASIALGASDARTIFRHILPNAMAPVLVSISFGITSAILTEAGLSFIGFGVTPPTPTWGQLLSETRESPLANWWLAVFPGTVLFLGVLAYNLVGEALRDALDPRTTL